MRRTAWLCIIKANTEIQTQQNIEITIDNKAWGYVDNSPHRTASLGIARKLETNRTADLRA